MVSSDAEAKPGAVMLPRKRVRTAWNGTGQAYLSSNERTSSSLTAGISGCSLALKCHLDLC